MPLSLSNCNNHDKMTALLEFYARLTASTMRYLPLCVNFLGLCTIFLCTLLNTPDSFAQTTDQALAVYTEVRNPPILSFNEAGDPEIRNLATRLVEAMLEEAGIPYQINVVPWARLQLSLAQSANSLAYPVGRTPDREDRFEWIGLIRPLEMNLYGLRSRATELPTTLEAAADYRIASIRGDVVDSYLHNLGFPNLVNISFNAPQVELLLRGRVDLVPFAAHGVEAFLQEHNYPVDTLYPAVNLSHVTDGLYIIMSKSSDPVLVNKLRQAYQALHDNGTYSELTGLDEPDR